MWKSAYKSPATTIAISQPQASARSDHFIDQPISFPHIISINPQYSQLYQKIYKSQQKQYNVLSSQQQKQKIIQIKQSITQKLLQINKQKSFNAKFYKLVNTPKSLRKIIKNQYFNSFVLATEKQQKNMELNNFLFDHRKAVQLQQQARLAQYHLRDQQKTKSKIDYINRMQLTDKHRRTQPLLKDRQYKLFKQNNQMNYQLNRKTAYIRNDKLMSMSLAKAKNNPTYCRMKNFSQIQYIINQDNKNLMATVQIPKNIQEQNAFSQKRRLFINTAFASDSLRTYYQYVRQKQFNKIIQLILTQTQSPSTSSNSPSYQRKQQKITSNIISSIIFKIIKYKQNKVIHFQDFIQILTTLQQLYNFNLLQKLNNKRNSNTISLYKKYLQYQLDLYILSHKTQISHIVASSKFLITAKKIYEIYKNKIISRQYLPLRDIVQLMKIINVVPKLIIMSKFMYICYWYQKRREGFMIDQFVEIMVAVGVEISLSSNAGLAQLQGFFQEIEMKMLVAN